MAFENYLHRGGAEKCQLQAGLGEVEVGEGERQVVVGRGMEGRAKELSSLTGEELGWVQ